MTIWTDFVKEYAKKNNMSYGCALSDKTMKEEYYKKYPRKSKEELKKEETEKLIKIRKGSVMRFKVELIKYLKDKKGEDLYNVKKKYEQFSQGLKDFIKDNYPKIHNEIMKIMSK